MPHTAFKIVPTCLNFHTRYSIVKNIQQFAAKFKLIYLTLNNFSSANTLVGKDSNKMKWSIVNHYYSSFTN